MIATFQARPQPDDPAEMKGGDILMVVVADASGRDKTTADAAKNPGPELYFEDDITVGAYRKIVAGGAAFHVWVVVWRDGAANAKPISVTKGKDDWPDWKRLVAKARKKLVAAKRNPALSRNQANEWHLPRNGIAYVMKDMPQDAAVRKKLIFDQ